MRLLNKTDEEMLKTIQISVHTRSKDKMQQYFKQNAHDHPDNPEAWFNHAVCSWVLMHSANSAKEKYQLLNEVLKACEKACGLQPDHWPAFFLRSMVHSLMASNVGDEMAVYLTTDYTDTEAERDRLKMIEFQKNTGSQPYFFIPYTELARQALAQNDVPKAESLIHQGLAETPAVEITHFRKLLSLSLRLLYRELDAHQQTGLAGLIRDRYNQLFSAVSIKGC